MDNPRVRQLAQQMLFVKEADLVKLTILMFDAGDFEHYLLTGGSLGAVQHTGAIDFGHGALTFAQAFFDPVRVGADFGPGW
jgi:hypothetical protein